MKSSRVSTTLLPEKKKSPLVSVWTLAGDANGDASPVSDELLRPFSLISSQSAAHGHSEWCWSCLSMSVGHVQQELSNFRLYG
mmetsp:Transcript_82084/g.144868  ORF Transcript_82084/g.144868 Transcript_82084/m.144868 type:complete len:83 (+) Transcript_82084:86-334(+)